MELATIFDYLLRETSRNEYISLKELKNYFWQAYSSHAKDYIKKHKICSRILNKADNLFVFHYMKDQHQYLKLEFVYKDKKYSLLIIDKKIAQQNNILDNYLLTGINKICQLLSNYITNGIHDYIMDVDSKFPIDTNLGKFIMSVKQDKGYTYDYVYFDFFSSKSEDPIFSEFYNPNIGFTKYSFKDFLFDKLRASQLASWSDEFNDFRKLILNTDFDSLIKIKISSLPKKIQNEIEKNIKPIHEKNFAIENSIEQIVKETLKNGRKDYRIRHLINREDICIFINNPIPHYELKPIFRYNGILRMLNLNLCSFDQVLVEGIDFSGTNATLNPQTVYCKSLRGTNCDGVTFLTLDFSNCILDDCKITFPNYVNLDNVASAINADIEFAFLNGQLITNKKLTHLK